MTPREKLEDLEQWARERLELAKRILAAPLTPVQWGCYTGRKKLLEELLERIKGE